MLRNSPRRNCSRALQCSENQPLRGVVILSDS